MTSSSQAKPNHSSVDGCAAMVRVEEAKAAHHEAERAYREAKAARDDEIRRVTGEITERHAPAISVLWNGQQAAFEARRAAENASATPHEWDGKRVMWKTQRLRNAWATKDTPPEFEITYGYVAAYRHGDYPGGVKPPYWVKHLHPGDAYVRLEKKDGTPGARVARLNPCWELAAPTHPTGGE